MVDAPGAAGLRAMGGAAQGREVPDAGLPTAAGSIGAGVVDIQALGSVLPVEEHVMLELEQEALLQRHRRHVLVLDGQLGQVDDGLDLDIQPGQQLGQQRGGDVAGFADAGGAGEPANGVGVDVDRKLKGGAQPRQGRGDRPAQRAEAMRIMPLPTRLGRIADPAARATGS